MKSVPEEDSSLSNLLTSQSRLLENWVQLFLFPRIKAAVGGGDKEEPQSVYTGPKIIKRNLSVFTHARDVREAERI